MTNCEAKVLEPGGAPHCRVRRLGLPNAARGRRCPMVLAIATAARHRDGGQ
jgi:hypothetical protein